MAATSAIDLGVRVSPVRLALRYLVLGLVAALILIPIYFTVLYSVLPSTRLLQQPPALFTLHPHVGSYSDAVRTGSLGRYLLNSFVVATLTTVGQLATSILAAYAFAFLRFPFRRALFIVFVATLMVPFEVTIIPNYLTIASLGWRNSYQGLVVPFLATAFGTFLLRQTFLTVPRDLQDAAALDGYGHLGFMARVAVPLARPTVAALAVFGFLSSWNQYLWPLLVTDKAQYRTVQIGLKALVSQRLDQFSMVFAGTVVAAVPIFVVLIVFQRHIIRGLTSGAVKG